MRKKGFSSEKERTGLTIPVQGKNNSGALRKKTRGRNISAELTDRFGKKESSGAREGGRKKKQVCQGGEKKETQKEDGSRGTDNKRCERGGSSVNDKRRFIMKKKEKRTGGGKTEASPLSRKTSLQART